MTIGNSLDSARAKLKAPYLLGRAEAFACRDTLQMLCFGGFFHAAERQTFIHPS